MVAVFGLTERLSYGKDTEEKGRFSRSRTSAYTYKNDRLAEQKINSPINPRELQTCTKFSFYLAGKVVCETVLYISSILSFTQKTVYTGEAVILKHVAL